ncbi:CMRF35-like molecule 5 isoform X2 [Rhinichthys klamathensis goyatoka]|uniref:CMRF35-like molecule 5 isoform X2 n=1 Tax=Rhinichthys klamathensis goyatoka TaxID=3034132 RepID=UPI0024B4BC87|nr:CMRF35-like molecule 5 isoform X2 [Rhinichthys klamathensis goyatoka]
MKIIWTFTLMMIPGVVSSMSVTGYSGGEVNITCKYDEGYTENTKYFCKGQWPDCTDQIKTDIKDRWFNNGRFSLYDNTRSAVFTVTIRDLREEDSGTYYCGVDIPKEKDPHTEVNLKVLTETNPHRTTSSFKAPAITSASPVTGSPLTVSVCVFLLLIIAGLVFVTVTLCRRRRSHNSSSKRSQVTPGNNEEVSHAGCDYKQSKELPTSPSDSSDKATGDSQCCITSAEDLNYAVVNFHKKSDCPDSVSIRNNQDYSEYAAVNRLR